MRNHMQRWNYRAADGMHVVSYSCGAPYNANVLDCIIHQWFSGVLKESIVPFGVDYEGRMCAMFMGAIRAHIQEPKWTQWLEVVSNDFGTRTTPCRARNGKAHLRSLLRQ